MPAIGFVIPVFSGGFDVIGKFEGMFKILNATLPLITRIGIWIGGPWIALVPFIFIIMGIVILVKSKSSFAKMIPGITVLLATTIYFKIIIVAIFGPIIELQKALM